jgi:AhpD family alkylhydroperoxidase
LQKPHKAEAKQEKRMRVPEKPISSYPWYLRPFFWNQKRKYGQILKPALIWARVPSLFAAIALLYGVLDRKSSPIDPVLRSLVTVRVSQINSCRFCIDINSAVLAKRAGSMNKVEALERWRESELFDNKERLVLEYVEAVTYTDRRVDDDLSQRLHEYFNEDEIVELTGLIAFQNLSSKFNSALDLPAQGFCRLPESTDHNSENR